MTLTEAKRALRRELRGKRLMLTPRYRLSAANRVAIRAQSYLAPGRRIAVYHACGSELSLAPLIARALARRCRVFWPVVPARGRVLGFVELTLSTRWRVSRLGIVEPLGPVVPASRLQAVFMPLVGFDAAGYRLGQGGGYYDCTLSPLMRRHARPWLFGCAFACQRADAIPREAHDLPLDRVLTEQRVWRPAR